jgi:Zn-finger nucleic acid-binding protein
MMKRENFRETSGVVVDVCPAHGIWFDRGELATLLEFAASGAMANAEHRILDRKTARKRLDAWSGDLQALGPRHYLGMVSTDGLGPIDVLSDLAGIASEVEPKDE